MYTGDTAQVGEQQLCCGVPLGTCPLLVLSVDVYVNAHVNRVNFSSVLQVLLTLGVTL